MAFRYENLVLWTYNLISTVYFDQYHSLEFLVTQVHIEAAELYLPRVTKQEAACM